MLEVVIRMSKFYFSNFLSILKGIIVAIKAKKAIELIIFFKNKGLYDIFFRNKIMFCLFIWVFKIYILLFLFFIKKLHDIITIFFFHKSVIINFIEFQMLKKWNLIQYFGINYFVYGLISLQWKIKTRWLGKRFARYSNWLNICFFVCVFCEYYPMKIENFSLF